MKRDRKHISVWLILAAALLAGIIGSAALGRYPISLKEMAGILLGKIFPLEAWWSPVQETLFLQHRLPRILMACMVGCSLTEVAILNIEKLKKRYPDGFDAEKSMRRYE